jgi:hypothetical protein
MKQCKILPKKFCESRTEIEHGPRYAGLVYRHAIYFLSSPGLEKMSIGASGRILQDWGKDWAIDG